jgi:hypothetical protein
MTINVGWFAARPRHWKSPDQSFSFPGVASMILRLRPRIAWGEAMVGTHAFAKAALVAALILGFMIPSRAQETSHLQFVTEYIRELGKMERLRSQANDELNDGSEKMAGCVRNATRFQLELQSQIFILRSMRLNPPFDDVAASLAAFDEQKFSLFKRMSEGCSALMVGPKPGVDYSAIATDAPKINAQLEYIDNAMFDASPMIFATLIDPVPDTNNKMSKLIITNAERKKLISDINSLFGAKLDQKNQNYVVSAASVLKTYLGKEKGYTASDEMGHQR